MSDTVNTAIYNRYFFSTTLIKQ